MVIDADWSCVALDDFVSLVRAAVSDDCVGLFPEPNLAAGRDNLLVGAPLLRLLAPEIYDRVRTPFPGCYAMKTARLREVVGKNYHCDWGGEVDVIFAVRSEATQIATPEVRLHERRHRAMDAKVMDSVQMYRAGIERGLRGGLIDAVRTKSIDDHLASHGELSARFADFLRQRAGLEVGAFVDRVHSTLGQQDAKGLYDWLFGLGFANGLMEMCVLAEMTLPAVSRLLFGKVLDRARLHEDRLNHKSPALRDAQLGADIIVHGALLSGSFGSIRDLPISEFTQKVNELVGSRPAGIDLLASSSAAVDEYIRLHNSCADSVEERSERLTAL